ncbi:MAG: hypothetical protein ACI9H6_000053 [Patiriisocius sp.]|jgi:hypothetical protein
MKYGIDKDPEFADVGIGDTVTVENFVGTQWTGKVLRTFHGANNEPSATVGTDLRDPKKFGAGIIIQKH